MRTFGFISLLKYAENSSVPSSKATCGQKHVHRVNKIRNDAIISTHIHLWRHTHTSSSSGSTVVSSYILWFSIVFGTSFGGACMCAQNEDSGQGHFFGRIYSRCLQTNNPISGIQLHKVRRLTFENERYIPCHRVLLSPSSVSFSTAIFAGVEEQRKRVELITIHHLHWAHREWSYTRHHAIWLPRTAMFMHGQRYQPGRKFTHTCTFWELVHPGQAANLSQCCKDYIQSIWEGGCKRLGMPLPRLDGEHLNYHGSPQTHTCYWYAASRDKVHASDSGCNTYKPV